MEAKSTEKKPKIKKIVKHRYFRKLLAVLILLFLFMVMGYRQYRQIIYIPEDGKAFKLDNYSLGREGDKPFYQTDDDLRLSRELKGSTPQDI